jgi:hypothetical protein
MKKQKHDDLLESMKRIDEMFEKIKEHDNSDNKQSLISNKNADLLTNLRNYQAIAETIKIAILADPLGNLPIGAKQNEI